MSTRGRRRAAAVRGMLLTAAGLCLCACAGGLFRSSQPPQSVYLLGIPQPAAPGARIGADIVVLHPEVRPGLDTRRIAVLYADRRLEHIADAAWSARLDDVILDLTLQAFHADAAAHDVHSERSAFGGGHWLQIEVLDFEAEYGVAFRAAASARAPIVHVRLLARLGAAGDSRALESVEADVREPAAENRVSAIVDAFDRAVAAALGRIVAATGGALRPAAASGQGQ